MAVHAEALADLTRRAVRVHLTREAGGREAEVQAAIEDIGALIADSVSQVPESNKSNNRLTDSFVCS